MNCPVCNVSLVMSDRNGVEIDYCPSCRGVWLDRGELDKIIERADGSQGSPRSRHQSQDTNHEGHNYRGGEHDDRRHNDYHDGHHDKKHKKEGFLGDLFDF